MPVVDVDRLKEQSRRFVDGFTPGQKAMTILGVVAVVLAGMTFMKWAAKPDYAPLYTGLSSHDAGAVTAALDSADVKYKITGGGGDDLVPRQDVDKTRIALSAKDIPAGGDSFALLDKQGITTDQFTRNIDYQRAMQGELGKTIESIDSVAAATVTLTIPQQTGVRRRAEDKPTAAVLVKTTGGPTLGRRGQAIVHLVASSIPNMNPDDVTVADANGTVLHAPGMDIAARRSAVTIEQTQTYDAALETEDRGHDRAGRSAPATPRSRVAADLDTSKSSSDIDQVHEPVAGQRPLPITQNDTNETFEPDRRDRRRNGMLGVGAGAPERRRRDRRRHDAELLEDHDQATATRSTRSRSRTPTCRPARSSACRSSVLLDSAVVKPADVATIWHQADPRRGRHRHQARRRRRAEGHDGRVRQDRAEGRRRSSSRAAARVEPDVRPHQALPDAADDRASCCSSPGGRSRGPRATACRCGCRSTCASSKRPTRARSSPPGRRAATSPRWRRAARSRLDRPTSTIEGEITDLIERQPDEVAQTLALLARRPEDVARGAEASPAPRRPRSCSCRSGKERAAPILRSLREQEVAEIMAEVARLHHLEVNEIEEVLDEFSRHPTPRARTSPRAATQTARELLEVELRRQQGRRDPRQPRRDDGRGAVRVPAPRRHPPGAHRTSRTSTRRRSRSCSRTCTPTRRAMVMSSLPEELQRDVALRIAKMDRTSPEVIEQVEAILERKLSTVIQQSDFAQAGGLQTLVDILNSSDRATERLILEGLEDQDAELADEVRNRMFVFEDISDLDDRSIQMVLRSVDAKELAVALKGVDQKVRNKVIEQHVRARGRQPRRGDPAARTDQAQDGRGGAGRHRARHPHARRVRPDRHGARRR